MTKTPVPQLQNNGSFLSLEPSLHASAIDLTTSQWPVEARTQDSSAVTVAGSWVELEAIGRLRYALYVERDGKSYAHADHHRKILIDEVDSVSLNFYFKSHGRILAAVRLTRAVDALHDPQLALVLAGIPKQRLANVVVNARLVVEPSMKGRKAVVPMLEEVYRAGLISGARRCLLSTRPMLARMFEKFGFLTTGVVFEDPVAGSMCVLCLDLHDFEYLRVIGSPLINAIDHPGVRLQI
jgi:predicted GNAT family N-acyltransferase